MNHNRRDQQFCSTMVVVLSSPLHKLKDQAFGKVKAKYLSLQIRKIDRLESASSRGPHSKDSYISITDFKPISNNYSSVKIFEGECLDSDNFQTKKQQVREHMRMEENKSGMIQLENWMGFQKAKQVLPESYPKSEYCSRQISSYSEGALETIKTFKFEVFCKNTLRRKKNWLNQDKDPMIYKDSPIKNSMVDLPEEQVETALDLFQLLLLAGGDIRSQTPWIYYLWKFMSEMQEGKMIEEGYFQVIKQLSNRNRHYLRIFCCICAFIRPSSRMYVPILNYLYCQYLEHPELSEYYNYCFFSLVKNFSDSHTCIPSMFDLFCVSEMRKIPLVISFPRQKLFFMEPYSRVEQLLDQLIKFYDLDDSVAYLINIRGVLMSQGYIMDTINRATVFEHEEEEIEERHWEQFNLFAGYKGYIVLKNMAIFEQSVGTFLIMFNHLVEQFRKGLFALTIKQAIKIGGLLMRSQLQTEQYFQFCLARYLPKNKYIKNAKTKDLMKAKAHILKNYYTFKGTKLEARKEIVSILRKSKLFLTHFFYGNTFINDQDQFDAWLGIQPGTVLIIDPRNSRVMVKVEFHQIEKWGKSKSQICLKVKKLGDVHFECKGVGLLASIYEDYLQFFCTQLSENKDKVAK